MFLAHEFRLAGFEVYQSALYTDRETGKSRELDVTAHYYQHLDFHNSIEIKLIIECKHAKTPWILFAGENPGLEILNSQYFYCCNAAGKGLLSGLDDDLEEAMFGSTTFKLNKCICYGLTEVHKKDNSKNELKNSHKAITTLINALLFEQDVENKKANQERNITEYIIYIPLIAIEGSIYKAQHIGYGQMHTMKIDEGQLLYKANVY
jgi:hypothetical protein